MQIKLIENYIAIYIFNFEKKTHTKTQTNEQSITSEIRNRKTK